MSVDRQALTELLLRLLERPTPWTPEREFSEAIQDFLGSVLPDELERIGCREVERDSFGNLLVTFPPGGDDAHGTLFVTYVMTHAAGTMPDPWRPDVRDGSPFGIDGPVVRGRGAVEQRGPMAALLAALATVAGDSTACAGAQVLALSAGETGTHDAIATAHAELPIFQDAAVVAVCTGGDVVRAHKGRVDVDVVVRGRAGHSSSPELADNAVERACEVLAALQRYDVGAPHPELGFRTFTPTAVRSTPDATHTVPGDCRLTIDHRLLPGDDPTQATRALARYLERVAGSLSVERGATMLPSDLPRDAPLVRRILSAARAATGEEPRVRCMSASTDTGYLNHHGIPAVCLGPGDIARAHTDDDLVAVEEVVRLAEVYATLFRAGPHAREAVNLR